MDRFRFVERGIDKTRSLASSTKIELLLEGDAASARLANRNFLKQVQAVDKLACTSEFARDILRFQCWFPVFRMSATI